MNSCMCESILPAPVKVHGTRLVGVGGIRQLASLNPSPGPDQAGWLPPSMS